MKVVHSRNQQLILLGVGLLSFAAYGCAALRETANLRDVQFKIKNISDTQLAGVDVSGLQSYKDLSSRDLIRLGAAASEGTLPLSFVLHLKATNPSTNDENARLTKMEWTLLLDETETVSGTYDDEVLLRPGEPTTVPVQVQLDLVRFFDENLREFVDLVSALTGDGPPQGLKVKVRPTINTRFGQFTYPSRITVVSEQVGDDSKP